MWLERGVGEVCIKSFCKMRTPITRFNRVQVWTCQHTFYLCDLLLERVTERLCLYKRLFLVTLLSWVRMKMMREMW